MNPVGKSPSPYLMYFTMLSVADISPFFKERIQCVKALANVLLQILETKEVRFLRHPVLRVDFKFIKFQQERVDHYIIKMV